MWNPAFSRSRRRRLFHMASDVECACGTSRNVSRAPAFPFPQGKSCGMRLLHHRFERLFYMSNKAEANVDVFAIREIAGHIAYVQIIGVAEPSCILGLKYSLYPISSAWPQPQRPDYSFTHTLCAWPWLQRFNLITRTPLLLLP